MLLAVVIGSGGGHDVTAFFMIFPWGMIGTLCGAPFSLLFLGLIQFPLYGYILDRFFGINRSVPYILVLQHIALVVLFIYLNDIHWRQ